MSEETPNQQYRRLTQQTTAAKRSKYGNQRIERDGIWYDSLAEYNYRGKLDMQVRAGEITGYDYHAQIPLLTSDGKLVGYYEVDYLVHMPDGSQQYHDVKAPGTVTDLFKWKARHVKAQYGVDVVLIDSKTLRPVKWLKL